MAWNEKDECLSCEEPLCDCGLRCPNERAKSNPEVCRTCELKRVAGTHPVVRMCDIPACNGGTACSHARAKETV